MEVDLIQGKIQIQSQVSRIQESPLFIGSIILRDFLNFIVDETLIGNSDGLKEYVIATSVLKKTADFNPQVSAIVRIHARRLRIRLDDYYLEEGKNDPIRISVPKGRYIPIFETNHIIDDMGTDEVEMLDSVKEMKPVIAVLPCTLLNHADELQVVCSVLSRDLSAEFTKALEMGVLPFDTAKSAFEKLGNYREFGAQMGVDYILTGTCIQEKHLKYTVELIALHNNQLLWAESFYLNIGTKFETQAYRNIVRKVMAMTCGYRGLVYRDMFKNFEPRGFGKYYALYWHNYYHQKFSEEGFHETLEAVDIGLEKNPKNSLLLAFKGELLLNLLAMDVQGEIDYLKAGTQLVEAAIGINQNCQHAHQVLAWSCMLQHDKEEFIRAIEKTMAINPYDVMYSGAAGFGYVCMGEYEKGLDLMSESMGLNPYYPWNLSVALSLYYIVHEEYKEAYYWAKMINRKALIWDPLLRCCTLTYLGKTEEASEAFDEIISIVPNFPERAQKIVSAFLYEESLQASILHGLSLAGLELKQKYSL